MVASPWGENAKRKNAARHSRGARREAGFWFPRRMLLGSLLSLALSSVNFSRILPFLCV